MKSTSNFSKSTASTKPKSNKKKGPKPSLTSTSSEATTEILEKDSGDLELSKENINNSEPLNLTENVLSPKEAKQKKKKNNKKKSPKEGVEANASEIKPKSKKQKTDTKHKKISNKTTASFSVVDVPTEKETDAGLNNAKESSEKEDNDGNDDFFEAKSDMALQSKDKETKSKEYRQRVLVLISRRSGARERHMMEDLLNMMPHSKKESKFDCKASLSSINETCMLNNCNNILFLQVKKSTDIYMWLSKAPNGPSAKFLVENMHTADELKFFGNCLKGSRPVLSFDKSFDNIEHLRIFKLLFQHIFAVPTTSRRIKPFVDHVISFSWIDNRIWYRNYQIIEGEKGNKKSPIELVEIGPRFTLNPIKILGNSMYGNTLYENESFVTPNTIRSMAKKEARMKAMERKNKISALQNSTDTIADASAGEEDTQNYESIDEDTHAHSSIEEETYALK